MSRKVLAHFSSKIASKAAGPMNTIMAIPSTPPATANMNLNSFFNKTMPTTSATNPNNKCSIFPPNRTVKTIKLFCLHYNMEIESSAYVHINAHLKGWQRITTKFKRNNRNHFGSMGLESSLVDSTA
ncbi:hypothetical protein FXE87_13295 [Vibrio mimicus]|nr:hypothetical protein FXE87_13295 [Vibrio mimicus]